MTGRPTKYKPEYVKVAAKLCELGATDWDIAQALSINVATLQRWKHTHPEFCDAIKTGKSPTDDRVEMSLYQRATGYSYESVKVFNHQGEPLIVPIVEHVPPDTGAMIFWLKNRRPESWRNSPEGAGGEGLADVLARVIDSLPS